MKLSRAGSLAVLLVLAGPAVSRAASVSSLGLTTGFDAGSGPQRAGSTWLAPLFSLDGTRAAMTLEGRFLGASFAAPDRAARLRLATMLSDQGWLRPELVMTATAGTGSETGVRQSIRAHLASASGGVWISASSQASVGGAERASLHLPLLGIGAWARSRHFSLTGAVEQNMGFLRATSTVAAAPPDTSRGHGTGAGDLPLEGLTSSEPRKVMLSTVYASARWDGERFELESIGGVTIGPLTTPRRWAQARAAMRLSPQLALVATAGSRAPQYYALEPTGERQAAIALRYSQSSSFSPRITLASRAQVIDCRIRREGEGLCRVVVRAPGARLVELQGDPTLWEPVALRPMSGERWEAELPMGPGVHRIGLRIDGGAWMPPPGLPTAPDGFGGSIGVAVIEP
jgi:hypothetical protein